MIGDNVHITTIYMPLVRTPMIAPTNIYDAFPTLSPEEAALIITDAMIDKPKRVATKLGHVRPDPLRGVAEGGRPDDEHRLQDLPRLEGREGGEEADHGRRRPGDGAGKKEEPEKDKEQEMSTEAIAMAYLMRGVHF